MSEVFTGSLHALLVTSVFFGPREFSRPNCRLISCRMGPRVSFLWPGGPQRTGDAITLRADICRGPVFLHLLALPTCMW